MAEQGLGAERVKQILRKGFVNILFIVIYISGTLFLSAGQMDWPQAWFIALLLVIYFVGFLIWGLRNNPDLAWGRGVERRRRQIEKQRAKG